MDALRPDLTTEEYPTWPPTDGEIDALFDDLLRVLNGANVDESTAPAPVPHEEQET